MTNNQQSLIIQFKVNGEIVMNLRSGGVYFEMYAGTSGFAFLQNINDGGQPIAILSSLDRFIEFFVDVDIPNSYDRNSVNNLSANIDFNSYVLQ